MSENYEDLSSWTLYYHDIAKCASLGPFGNSPDAIFKDKAACKHAHDTLRTKFEKLSEETDYALNP